MIVNTCGFIDAAKQESVDAILELARAQEARGRSTASSWPAAWRSVTPTSWRRRSPRSTHFIGLDELEQAPAAALGDAVARARLAGQRGPRASTTTALRGCCATPRPRLPENRGGVRQPLHLLPIPQMRGASARGPWSRWSREARSLEAPGVHELILIAQDTTRYGEDLGLGPQRARAGSSRRCSRAPRFPWIRFLYAYPTTLDERSRPHGARSRASSPTSTCRCSTFRGRCSQAMRRGGDASARAGCFDRARRARARARGAYDLHRRLPGRGGGGVRRAARASSPRSSSTTSARSPTRRRRAPGAEPLGDPVPRRGEGAAPRAPHGVQQPIAASEHRALKAARPRGARRGAERGDRAAPPGAPGAAGAGDRRPPAGQRRPRRRSLPRRGRSSRWRSPAAHGTTSSGASSRRAGACRERRPRPGRPLGPPARRASSPSATSTASTSVTRRCSRESVERAAGARPPRWRHLRPAPPQGPAPGAGAAAAPDAAAARAADRALRLDALVVVPFTRAFADARRGVRPRPPRPAPPGPGGRDRRELPSAAAAGAPRRCSAASGPSSASRHGVARPWPTAESRSRRPGSAGRWPRGRSRRRRAARTPFRDGRDRRAGASGGALPRLSDVNLDPDNELSPARRRLRHLGLHPVLRGEASPRDERRPPPDLLRGRRDDHRVPLLDFSADVYGEKVRLVPRAAARRAGVPVEPS